MIKIAICDDKKQEILNISNLLEEFIEAHLSEYSITYTTFQSGADLLAAKEKGQVFDILLLDIIMPFVNGLELAGEIRSSNTVSKIIFLTSSPEFAVDSYSLDAFYYMLKPIKKAALFAILEKACADIVKNLNEYILVKRGANLTKILLNDIVYAEVLGHMIFYRVKTGDLFECLGNMKELEIKLLCDRRFIKPHRSYVVNFDYIVNLSPKGIVLTSGENIPISRNIYKEIKQAYIDYSFDRR